MRKLKLNMQITLDGFVARPNGELDWMTLDLDDKLRADFNSNTASFDTILMGRKMTPEFMDYWTKEVKNSQSPEYPLAKMMVEYPKIVFTKTLDKTPSWWPNTTLAKGDLVDEVNRVKNREGIDATPYECGVTIHRYLPAKAKAATSA